MDGFTSSSTSSASSPFPLPAKPPLVLALTASAVAGGLEPLLTYPLERIKTQQQLATSLRTANTRKAPLVNHADLAARSVLESIEQKSATATSSSSSSSSSRAPRTGFVGVAREVWQQNGARGFYRGVAIVSAGGVGKAAVRMGVYDRLKSVLQTSDGVLTGGRSLLAGLGAGLAETLLFVIPSETIKTKIIHASTLTASEHTPFRSAAANGSMAAVRMLREKGGARGLYAGVTATLARQLTASMTRFGSYSTMKNIVGGSMRPGQKLPSGITFGLGALSGMTTVFITMPFDVVKTRMQSIGAKARYRNTWWCLVQTVQQEGLRTLWRGSTMRLCRLTFSGAITFGVYEEAMALAGYA